MVTPSFTLCLSPALGNQLGDKIAVFGDAARDNGLRFPNRLFRSTQPQLALAHRLDQQFVAWL